MPPSERREDPVPEDTIAASRATAAGFRRCAPAAGRTLSRLSTGLAGAFIVLALLLGLLRFGFPLIENHRPEVERWVGQLLQRPVSIVSLRARWRGWSPELEIYGLKLHRSGDDGADGEPAITFDQVRIRLDPVDSVKSRRLLAHAVTIEGASLTVERYQDGSIHIAGMQASSGAVSSQMPEDLARWILKDGVLVFDSTTISWVDARRGSAPILLTSARVEFSNHGENHRLSGTFRIPGMSQERIQFALDASGDLSTSSWSGRMVVIANGIQTSQLSALLKGADKWVSGGKTDLSVWTEWKHGAMDRAQMKIRADGLMLSELLGGLRVHGGTAEVQIGRLKNGWSADLLLREIHTSEGRWRTSRGALNYITDEQSKNSRLVGRLEHAKLADLASLLQSRLKKVDFASAAVETYRPNADLSNLHFSMGLGTDAAETFELTADFEKLSAFVGPAFPALSGYSGRIEIDGEAGVVSMNGGTLDFALDSVFDGRFLIQTRGGRFAWRQQPEGLRLDVHDVGVEGSGFEARFAGFARFDGDASGPLLNLVASLSSDDVGALRRYVPGGILQPKLGDWLRRAIMGGRVTDGQLLLHGRLADFPFDQKNGVLEARFAIEDGELEYHTEWPRFSDLSGELRFRGRRLDANLDKGRIFDARIETGSVTIDELGQGVPVIKIDGVAKGSAAQGIKFLSASPLKNRISKDLRGVAAGGEVKLNLALDIPLDKSGIRVDGRVALRDNSLDFPNLKSGLNQVTGTLQFNRNGARAKSIEAVYLGRPVIIDVATKAKAPHDTRVRISGRADRRFVAMHLSNSGLLDDPGDSTAMWLQRLDGETEWLATVDIPAAAPAVVRRPGIRLQSSLEGLRIDLPYPIGKEAGAPRALSISTEAGNRERREIRIQYGDNTRAALELEARNGKQGILRGALQLGGGDASLPESEGIYVDGGLPQLPVGEWVHTWTSAFAPENVDPPPQNRLKRVALDIGRLQLLGSNFEQVNILAIRNENGSWNTRFDGPGLKGTVRVLKDGENKTLHAAFEEIDYRSAPKANGTQVSNPKEFPTIRLMSERFLFNGRDLGEVELLATPTAAGLNFAKIMITSREFEARANGFWHHTQENHHSDFSISLHSDSLSGFLESMGFGGTETTGGATDIFLNARWDASPMEFSLRKLNGALHFRSAGGRLLGVKRGTTERIFGLLSVTTLPQRLILDFTDLFEKGVSFDSIDGSFSLANGDAYTNNLTMETGTARVEIAGRTGLVAEDYDQVMTVTPKLTSSLPLAPIWLAEKAFNRELFGRTFSSQYTITGSWTDPKIEPIQVEANPAEKG